jgi:hypothetical protein
MGGRLAVDLMLDVRLRFGGRAGGGAGASFREEPGASILKHISYPDSWYH